MSFGVLKPAKRFISKPFGGGFQINWDNPLCKNLLLAIPLGSAGNREVEYVERIYSQYLNNVNSPLIVNGNRYWKNVNDSNNAVRFSPKSSHVSIGSAPYTVLARIRCKDYTASTGAILASNNYDPNFGIYQGTGKVIIYDGGEIVVSPTSVKLDDWSEVGWVRNSTATNDSFIYLDGRVDALFTHSSSIPTSTALTIGVNGAGVPGGYRHYGYIDFVFLWKRALSLHEINAFFNNPNQIFSFKGSSVFLAKAPFDGRLLSGSVQSQPATTTGTIETICSLSGNVQSQQASLSGVIDTDANNISASLQAQSAILDANINVAIGLSCSLQAQPALLSGVITLSSVHISASIQAQQAKMLSFRILCIGQSNMAGWDSSLPKLSSSYVSTLMWKNTTARWQQIVAPDATSGNPGTGSSIMHNLNDKLHELTGRVVGSLNTGYGGIGVVKGNSGQEGWSIHTSTPWVQMASKVAATGGAFDCVIHWGGESDVGQLVTREQFRDGLTSLFNNLKTLLNNDLLYMFCVKTSCPDYDDVAVRQGYDDFIAQTNRAIVFEDAANYPVIDTFQHIAKENMALIGAIGGQAIYDWIIAKNKNKVISSLQSQQASLSGVIDTDANNISASLQAQSAILDANINVAIGLSCSLQAQVASLDSSIQVKLLLFGLLQSQQATMTKYHGTVRSSTAQSLSLSLKIGF